MADALPSTSSQNLGLSPIKKLELHPTNEAQNVEGAPFGEFSSVFHENDVTMNPSFDDESFDCIEIANSSSPSSLSNNGSNDSLETDVRSRPYVPFSIEEVSLVKALHCWTNCNVRVIGTMIPTKISCDLFSLQSIGEEGGPFSILVDIKLLMTVPPIDSAVQIFGEIQMVQNSVQPRPFILAKFFRDMSSVDLSYYCKALEELKKYVPHFMKKRTLLLRQVFEEESQSDE